MDKNQITRLCGICDKPKKDGIYLYQLFICTECEMDIVATDPRDEAYSTYVKKLKAINQSTFTM
ncbi:Inhibitor of sigma-G Gin [Gracilibacillus ureilyticus]|uniref:Inhibitor of sigma-G Gin n=1 Tax=Gracilibacillus ureilyticus TaxID=531814 RepID=A0A1H9VNY4_9BACI|nr:sigma factor G inhibitor Gin [Gracilibacillus ureilyticus]SES23288.1 Inhibitor of sigma-G Gin [Gracilibacillus ureilyticus]